MSDIRKKIAKQLYENFVVNNSVIGIQREDGKYIATKTLVSELLIEKMLDTGSSLGTYQQQTYSDTLRWVCFDFDCKCKESLEDALELKERYVKPFVNMLDRMEISYILEFSGRRGFHVWILLDRLVSKDIGYSIVQRLAGDVYREISSQKRFGLDLFPKTFSGRVKNKYGLMVKLPLSKHKKGWHSQFVSNINDFKFTKEELINEEFWNKQYKYLEQSRRNSVDDLLNKLEIIREKENKNVCFYKKEFVKQKGKIEFSELEEAFLKDGALEIIWNNIINGRMSILDKKVMLGTFAHIQGGDSLLWEIFCRQCDFDSEITKEQIRLNRKRFFPLTMRYLHELYSVKEESTNETVLEFILRNMEKKFEIITLDEENTECDIRDIVEKEKNYLLYNDEVIAVDILNELNSFTLYDFVECEKYIKKVISGEIIIPKKIDFKLYERKEKQKTRKMISLYPKERVITTALIYELLKRLQRDYDSYSYHLNTSVGGDVFYPWISSWKRFNVEILKYFQLQLFEDMSFIKADLKSCYDHIYLQVLRNVLREEINSSKEVEYICNYLISFNERLMLCINSDSQGVPQGPAYARVLAEYVLDASLRLFWNKYSYYEEKVKIYRYVDDMYIFYDSSINGKVLLRDIAEVFENNKLFFNREKTKVYGKISEMSFNQIQEYREKGDMVYDIQKKDDFEVKDTEFDEVYSRYIFRKKEWDINDANFILSSTINTSIKKKYINDYFIKIIRSEVGRGSVFNKFYKFILEEEEYCKLFLENRYYLEIPTNSINFKNFVYQLFSKVMNGVFNENTGLILYDLVDDLLKDDNIEEEQKLLLLTIKDKSEGA